LDRSPCQQLFDLPRQTVRLSFYSISIFGIPERKAPHIERLPALPSILFGLGAKNGLSMFPSKLHIFGTYYMFLPEWYPAVFTSDEARARMIPIVARPSDLF
jgi:hypothetical protein